MNHLKILNIPNTCTGCGACVSTCPKGALKLSYDDTGFYIPSFNEELCIDCKACERVCHVLNNAEQTNQSKGYSAYMLKAKDRNIVVKHSSSGGAFTLMAQEVLSNDGLVYGARYNFELERLEHASTDNASLDELQKSKYIESYMGKTFKDVYFQLKSGRYVMFVGTPCQVEGLYTFLTKRNANIENLLLVRFVCHGVPSNKFFTEYKHYEEQKRNSKMVYFDFRPKITGWRHSTWLMQFSNGKIDKGPYNHYYYYYYFQLSTLLRNSCYKCKRICHEIADVTIGDFWGIQNYRPENKESDGISLFLAHTEKGKNILNKISKNCFIEKIPYSSIDYIYREVTDREANLKFQKQNIAFVKEKGYMKFAKKTLGKKIFLNKTKFSIRNLFKRILK